MGPPVIALPPIDIMIFYLDPVVDDAPAEYGFVCHRPGISGCIEFGAHNDIPSIDFENVLNYESTHFRLAALFSLRKQII